MPFEIGDHVQHLATGLIGVVVDRKFYPMPVSDSFPNGGFWTYEYFVHENPFGNPFHQINRLYADHENCMGIVAY